MTPQDVLRTLDETLASLSLARADHVNLQGAVSMVRSTFEAYEARVAELVAEVAKLSAILDGDPASGDSNG